MYVPEGALSLLLSLTLIVATRTGSRSFAGALPKNGEPIGKGLVLGFLALGSAGSDLRRAGRGTGAVDMTRQPKSASATIGKTIPSPAVRKSILVVDDDPDVCDLLGYVLRTEGLPVITASSGQHALSQARSEPPLLVLLDLELPGLRGEAVANELRAMYGASLPIVVVSAAIDAAAVANRIGALTCLSKPFQVNDLLAAVHRARRTARIG